MHYIEVHLLNGNKMSVRKDLVLAVATLEHVSKQALKDKPFLKDCMPCTWIQLSIQPGELYCSDSYDTIMQMLSD